MTMTEHEAISALLDLATTCPELTVTGSPPGVVAGGEWDVTDEVLTGCLPMARLTARYREALEEIVEFPYIDGDASWSMSRIAREALDSAP
jgi:hypothetical protein